MVKIVVLTDICGNLGHLRILEYSTLVTAASAMRLTGASEQHNTIIRAVPSLVAIALEVKLRTCFLPMMPRSAENVLEPIALPKAIQEKDSSFSDASATPLTIGIRLRYTGKANTCTPQHAMGAHRELHCSVRVR